MEPAGAETVYYKRARFITRLPVDRLYTASHYWMAQQGDTGLWRVGLTKFATRMLGDLVEYSFSLQPGDQVDIGQVIGWIEGFKAVADIYCVVSGEFAGASPRLEQDITLVESDPYGEGWLYSARGTPEPAGVDVHGYMAVLDTTIDQMLRSRHEKVNHA
jgi:glycine cleavage system H protein